MIFFNFVIHLSLILETFVISWNTLLIISFCDIVYTQHNWFWKYLWYTLITFFVLNYTPWSSGISWNEQFSIHLIIFKHYFQLTWVLGGFDCPLFLEAAVVMIVWYIYNDLHNQCLSPLNLWVQTPFIPEVYSMQHYVIKFVSYLRQISGFLRFPPPIKLTAKI